MKKVTVEPGCITCGSCEFIAPEVFEVTDKSQVKKNVHWPDYTEKIKLAARKCPVQVITFEE